MSNKTLVLLDTDKIHEYVFATNKLREIRGASAILDMLNLDTTYQILKNFGSGNYDKQKGEWQHNGKTIESDSINWEVIFLGGGSGKILFLQPETSKQFCRKLSELYRTETDGAASVTAVVVTQNHGEDFLHFIYRGEKELRKQKDSKHRRFQPITSPYFKICESTGMLPAEKIGQGDRNLICQASYIKRQQEEDKDSIFFRKFKQFLEDPKNKNGKLQEETKDKWIPHFQKQKIKDFLPDNLGDIGALSNNYLGLIYADGNRMGQRFAQLDRPEAYRKFSDKVKDGTQDAIFESIACHLGMNLNLNQKCFPFEILLLGGDDLIAVVPANQAIEIAIDFCEGFKTRTGGISISVGVAIAHVNYPIHRLIEHAEDLLKSAKRKSNKNPKDEICAIDFMVLKGALLQDVKEIREKELSYFSDDSTGTEPNIKLYQRPYTIDELSEIVRKIRRLKGDEGKFPRNKLMAMYETLYRGKAQAMLDYLLILSRLDKNKARKVIDNEFLKKYPFFPWVQKDIGEWETPFLDVIELYDFIDEK